MQTYVLAKNQSANYWYISKQAENIIRSKKVKIAEVWRASGKLQACCRLQRQVRK